MLKVLIADRFPEDKQQALQALGLEVAYDPQLSAESLPGRLEGVHILCVRSTRVSAQAIQATKSLLLILRVGSGTNTIDVQEASRQGVYVANCPGKNAIAVAELTMGLLLALDRRIPQATAALHAGTWNKKEYAKADGLKDKRIGIVGFGRIGQEVARRAKAFAMHVMAYSRDLTPQDAKPFDVEVVNDLGTLCQHADIISVHLPLTPETRGLFDAKRFAQMQEGAIFLNTSRGPLHDEDALIDAVRTRGLRVGLDVFATEPSQDTDSFHNPLLEYPDQFVATPHIGASTQQAQHAVAAEAVHIIRTFLQAGTVPNCINLQQHTPVECQLIVRHFDKVGVLATVMEELRRAHINIEEMSNMIFQNAQTAIATMRLSHLPSPSLLHELESKQDMIIQVTLISSPNAKTQP